MGVNLDTLRPEPTVEGFTTPGGYSCKAVRPIALRMVMEIATMIRSEFPGRSLSGIGGIESGGDAAQFILLGADTAQVCTGVMKFGYESVKRMCDELLVHGEAQVRDAGRFQRQEPRLFHHARGAGAHADRAQGGCKAHGRRRPRPRKWSAPTANGAAMIS